jgi:hypothetical protein
MKRVCYARNNYSLDLRYENLTFHHESAFIVIIIMHHANSQERRIFLQHYYLSPASIILARHSIEKLERAQ